MKSSKLKIANFSRMFFYSFLGLIFVACNPFEKECESCGIWEGKFDNQNTALLSLEHKSIENLSKTK